MRKLLLLLILSPLCIFACGGTKAIARVNAEQDKSADIEGAISPHRLEWSITATATSNYIWRGLYVGGPSLQVDATINYAGFFANMWWNMGTTDWTFSQFNPELDICIGFSKWGLSVYYIHMYYFDRYLDGRRSHFFDFRNHEPGGGGTTGEWRIAYRISDKIPLSILLATRTFGRDGFLVYDIDNPSLPPQLKRAYSTYIELGYDFHLGQNWQLDARLGITPAKSLYTGFQGDFAISLIGIKLHKHWLINQFGKHPFSKGMHINAFAHVMLQPWQVTKDNLIRPIDQVSDQRLNLAVGCTVGL